MPAINDADPRPLAEQVTGHLRAQIQSGALEPGQRLPTTGALRDEWGVSDVTIRRAVAALRHEGLIYSRQGKGVYVRVLPTRVRHSYQSDRDEKQRALADLETRRRSGTAESDMGVSINDLDFQPKFTQHDEAPAWLVEEFGLGADSRVLEREYITRDPKTGLRTSWSRSWLPVNLIEGNPELLEARHEPWPGGTPHALWTVGIELDQHIHAVTAHAATADEQQSWGLPDGVPMLHSTNRSYNTDERLVMISEVVHPADRTELVFQTQLERW